MKDKIQYVVPLAALVVMGFLFTKTMSLQRDVRHLRGELREQKRENVLTSETNAAEPPTASAAPGSTPVAKRRARKTNQRGSQTGFYKFMRFRKVDARSIEMRSRINKPLTIPLRGPPGRADTRVGGRLVARLAEPVPNTGGYFVYLVADRPNGRQDLIFWPAGKKFSLPMGFRYYSEPLWYVFVQNKQIKQFFDLGSGINRYFDRSVPTGKPLTFPVTIRASSIKGSLISAPVPKEITSLSPSTASEVYFEGFVRFGPEQNQHARVEIASRKGHLIWSRVFALPSVKAAHLVQFNSSYMQSANDLRVSFLNFTRDSIRQTKVSLQVTGWRMNRRYE